MSTCTINGYARNEPSPRGYSYLMAFTYPLGVLHWPRSLSYGGSTFGAYDLGEYSTSPEEVESYMSSALWQPFPFSNFNFLFDVADPSASSDDPPGCHVTYATSQVRRPHLQTGTD